MATITIEVVTGQGTVTNSRTVTAPHLIRFIAAYRAYKNISPAATDAQVIAQWQADVFRQARGIVKQLEEQAAANTAVAGVTEIEM